VYGRLWRNRPRLLRIVMTKLMRRKLVVTDNWWFRGDNLEGLR
jgi:hypothetical protein